MFSFFSSVGHDVYAEAACIITFASGFIGLIGGLAFFFHKNFTDLEAAFDPKKEMSLLMEYVLIGYFLLSVSVGACIGAFVGALFGELVFDCRVRGVLISGAIAAIAGVYWFHLRHRIWIYFNGGHIGDIDQQHKDLFDKKN